MAITLRQLTYLSALAKHRHFAHAAESVHVTQSALSQQIKELERTLGATLVERNPRGITLTATGRDVLARAKNVLAEVRDIEQVARLSMTMPAELRIGLIPTIAPYVLPHFLPLIRAQNIGMELGIREAQTDILLSELERGKLDAVVIALPSLVDGVIETPLITDHFFLAGRPQALAELPQTRLRPSEIRPDQLLLLDDGHCLADQALAACGIAPSTPIDLRASSLTTLCGLASAGFGFTLVPEIAVANELRATADLQVMRFSGRQPSRKIGLVRRSIGIKAPWFTVLEQGFKQAFELAIKPAKARPVAQQ
ncbi:LysR family transcriptional regulator [Amylibacter marinus]|uniref:LysR family transcriptional regulator n=1 Tax=Amylibacter marinus TaxID=1475483 RepID=A0ABQ5VSI1_9RHOB|nr:LysR substrate-binding domain-containing protein [Amylibacter marinus]GLQ34336.1 LysR family transcriptional regulator [Amylibacter marinus]